MTLQDLFDQVAGHLLSQNRVSENEQGCAYRGDTGLKCAIGCLITDAFYDEVLEGASAYEPMVMDAVSSSLGIDLNELPDHVTLLSRLQKIHDREQPDEWRTALEKLAAEYHLNWSD